MKHNCFVSHLFLKLLIICTALPAYSYKAIEVKGLAVDSITGERLPYVNIKSVRNKKNIVQTDDNGYFTLLVTDEDADWTAEYVGYETRLLTGLDSVAQKGATDTITPIYMLRLSPNSHTLAEITVRPGKVKYSKKNNPAVDLIRKVREKGRDTDPKDREYYSYDKYEKTLVALNEFKGDSAGGLFGGKRSFLLNYVDTSSYTGKRLLDIILKEKYSVRLLKNGGKSDKEVVKGYRSKGIDEVFNQQNMQAVVEDAIREVEIFDNDVNFLQNRFVSPLSVIGPDFYKYYITDTAYIGDEKCIELTFAPHNPETMGFNGKLYIVADSSYFLKKAIMRTPHDINLNYVENIFVNQSFIRDSLGNRHKRYDDVCVEMQIVTGTPRLYARKTTSYDNFNYEVRDDLKEFYDRLGSSFVLDESAGNDDAFWEENRMVPLTRAESRMGYLMSDMRRIPVLYWGEKVLSLLESGYVRTGKPSKVDLGPINTLVSGNTVEGIRLRLGGMTMSPLNPHLFASGYVAYGTKDHKWKYNIDLEYSFTRKRNHSYEWPRHGFYASYGYDVDMLGQHYLFTNSDNVFLSLKRMESILATYRRLAKGGYILELPNNFSVDFNLRQETQESTMWVPFVNGYGQSSDRYRQSWFSLSLRYAPGEKFLQGRTTRSPINMDAWIFQFTHEFGPKGMFGSAFTLNRSEVSVQKRIWMSAFGYANIILKGGIVWSKVLYPALLWPNANLSYTIQPESYSLMNPMEFANDRYASIDIAYFGNGVLFNRIPLLKRLKLREAVTFKGLMGGLSDRNNPAFDKNLYLFPLDSKARVMGGTPYMEVGVGIDNILTVLRVDYVWRLTYLDTPGIDKSGLRIALHFSF